MSSFSGGRSAHRGVQVDVVVLRDGLQRLPVVAALFARAAPLHGDDGAFVQRDVRVRDEQVGVDLQLAAQALAVRAGAVRGVEGEGARLDLRQAEPCSGQARCSEKCRSLPDRPRSRRLPARRLSDLRSSSSCDGQVALAKLEGGLDRVGQARADRPWRLPQPLGWRMTRRSTTASMVWIL